MLFFETFYSSILKIFPKNLKQHDCFNIVNNKKCFYFETKTNKKIILTTNFSNSYHYKN